MQRRTLAAAALALLATAPLSAQAPAPSPTVVRAARMLDVATGRMVANPVVVVENGRIAAVNPATVPAGAQTIELGDVTLLPGLMDAHVHLTGEIDEHFADRPVRDLPAMEAFHAAANARKTLMAGFTTVRNVGSGGFTDVALDEAVEEGVVVGPDIVPAGHSLGITGGHCDVTGFAPGVVEQDYRTGVADGADEAVKAVRYQIKHGADVIKICATAGVLSFEKSVGAQQFTDQEMRAIVEEAARHGIKVAAHAHGTEGIKAAVRAGVASIEHGSVLDDEAIRLMKERGTYLVPTTALRDLIPLDKLPPPLRAKAESVFPLMRESLRRAIRAGVPIAFGTDAAVMPHGLNAREFAAMVELGMEPLQAVRTATVHAADLLDLDDRGVIAPGKRADLVAVPGNPLEDIRVMEDVRFVMKGGTVHKTPGAGR
jgi:imidazolonepropionase-like amidohydrolase